MNDDFELNGFTKIQRRSDMVWQARISYTVVIMVMVLSCAGTRAMQEGKSRKATADGRLIASVGGGASREGSVMRFNTSQLSESDMQVRFIASGHDRLIAEAESTGGRSAYKLLVSLEKLADGSITCALSPGVRYDYTTDPTQVIQWKSLKVVSGSVSVNSSQWTPGSPVQVEFDVLTDSEDHISGCLSGTAKSTS